MTLAMFIEQEMIMSIVHKPSDVIVTFSVCYVPCTNNEPNIYVIVL